MLTPLAFIAAFAAFLALPHIHNHPDLTASFAGAIVVLLVWWVYLWRRSRSTRTRLKIDISLRPQHYLQAIAHTAIFVYWGMYWPPIQEAAPLIAGQIVFAYAFDSLLSWTRKDAFVLGFGPFPIIYSTNLFLRFHDDWFYLQFLMVAIGFLAKELIRWTRDGRRVHIFNPSSFPLALVSFILIVTQTSRITWAEQIATLLILPPHIYLFIFLVALPGQFLFGVTSMTLPAVLATYAFSMLYLALTGTYFFFDSNVPIAVFLGMHLLFTDPSTAPKTELGRILFGVCYGLSVVALYALLDSIGAPTYYDKLLQVPIMNMLVKQFDLIGRSASWSLVNPARLGAALPFRARSAVYVSLWIITFGVMTRADGLGNRHPGQEIPFWQAACAADRVKACDNLAQMHRRYCSDGSPWSCNELALLAVAGKAASAETIVMFKQACRSGSVAACENVAAVTNGRMPSAHGDPLEPDYRLVLQGGRGPLPDLDTLHVFTRACDQGFVAGCGSIGDVYFQGKGVARDQSRAIAIWQDACDRGHATSCTNLAVMHHLGDGVPKDDARAGTYLARGCELGMARACQLAAELKGR